jgi:ketosteroid isomerase-like protein
MDMPSIVKAYFEADHRNDAQALLATFAADAAVEDEGNRHEGPTAIRDWWMAAKERYQHVAEPIESTVANDRVHVLARVSGRFPNSPATLAFAFTVTGDRIVALEIR